MSEAPKTTEAAALAPPPPAPPPAAARPTVAPRRRPFQGWGAAFAGGARRAAGGLARVSALFFGQVLTTTEKAYADFQKQRRHTRLRAYAIGSYGVIVAVTLLAQLYSRNSIRAYVRVEPVDLPAITAIFLRNDSDQPWLHVRVVVNGKFGYEHPRLGPGEHKLLRIDRFEILDSAGRLSGPRAPADTRPVRLRIEADRGHFETDLPSR